MADGMTLEEALAAATADDGSETVYCTVDDDTRLVTIPDNYKKLGVESDEKAKRIWFRFPKVVGNNGVDLSAIGVRVNFRNANGDGDIYIVEDLTTDGDYVTFSWELTRKVTAYKGNVSFVVCAVKSATDGTTKNEWNTTLNKECEVLEGLEVSEQIAQENPDIIEYILANLGGSVSSEEIATAVEEYMVNNPIEETDPTVPDWAKRPEKPSYTASEVGALPDTTKIPSKTSDLQNDSGFLTEYQDLSGYALKSEVPKSASDVGADAAGTAVAKVSEHNTASNAHDDIRLLVQGLTERLNALADSDDETLDQMSEVVAYIKSNKSLIDAITTSKVNVSDIIDNLTTNVSNKPLSAAQGVKLKALIDAIVVPTKLSELENDSGYAKTTDIPDKLPNPQKLTFDGAVTAEYDGSGAVTVTIPEGGGTGVTVDNTLSVAGKAADAKATGDAINSLSEKSGGGYKYEYVGCPFPALDNYQSWPIAGVQYDASLDRIMCLVTDADTHVDATRIKLNLYALNPVTSEIKLIQTLKDNTVESVIDVHPAFASQRGFLIDNDTGIYYKFHFDGTPYACKSSDGGVSWEDIAITETNNTDILFGVGNGKIIKTSSGRIICGLFCNGFAYTDDYFQTLTYVTSGKVSSNGSASCHEYELIEYDTGKLIAIMRYTWSSTNTGVWNGTKVVEPAWISYSEDNGTTWSVPVPSTTITNMSATNCVSFVDGDSLELYVGCRYPLFADKNGAIFRYTASLSDIKDDAGNLAGCRDSVGNFHLFYNDGKAQGTSRWHYVKVCKATDNNSNVQEEPKNKDIQTYNATTIDSLLKTVYEHVTTVKNELLLKLGEVPESGDLVNPTYWVSDGLMAMYTFTEGYWDSSVNHLTPAYVSEDKYKDAVLYLSTSQWDATAPTEFSANYVYSSTEARELMNDVFVNSTDGWTMEVDIIPGQFVSNTDLINVKFNSYIPMKFISYCSAQILEYSTSEANTSNVLGGVDLRGFFTISNHTIDTAHTIAFTFDRINMISSIYLDGKLLIDSSDYTVSDGYSLDFAIMNNSIYSIDLFGFSKKSARLYNRALTAEEINANAIYSNQ